MSNEDLNIGPTITTVNSYNDIPILSVSETSLSKPKVTTVKNNLNKPVIIK